MKKEYSKWEPSSQPGRFKKFINLALSDDWKSQCEVCYNLDWRNKYLYYKEGQLKHTSEALDRCNLGVIPNDI